MAEEVVVAETETSWEELEEDLERRDPSDFSSVKPPEELEKLSNRWQWARSASGVIYPTASITGMVSLFAMNSPLNVVTGLGLTAASFSSMVLGATYSPEKVSEYEDEKEKWHEVPAMVDLSYLKEDSFGMNNSVPKSYERWRFEKASEWATKSQRKDELQYSITQELEEIGIETEQDEAETLDPFELGRQRVYIDQLDEDMGGQNYQFVMEVYGEGDLLYGFQGFTDEKGRHIIEENDGARNPV